MIHEKKHFVVQVLVREVVETVSSSSVSTSDEVTEPMLRNSREITKIEVSADTLAYAMTKAIGVLEVEGLISAQECS